MALIDIATSYKDRSRLSAIPEQYRNAAFKAMNPQMHAMVERADSFPEQTGLLIKKLDATSAEELASRLSEHAALRSALADRREGVQHAIFGRARALNLNLHQAPVEVVEEQKTAKPARTPQVSRTQRVLAKPMKELVPALAKMATLDQGDVIAWSETLGADAPWGEILAAVKRHHGLAAEMLRAGLRNEAISVDELWEEHRNWMIHAASGMHGELNVSHVKVLELGLQAGLHFQAPQPDSLNAAARQYLENASTSVRQLCGVASVEEVRSAVEAELSGPLDRDAENRIMSLFVNIKDAEMADALMDTFLAAAVKTGNFGWRFARSIASYLAKIDGISRESRRSCWALLEDDVDDILEGSLGGLPDEEDLVWLVANHGVDESTPFDLSRTISRLNNGFESEGMERKFVEMVIDTVPGAAGVILQRLSYWSGSWAANLVMERAAAMLQENETAWKVFLQGIDGHSGTLDELVLAAVIATQN